ncbi:hypothetical protein L873DRAFT_1789822 [Choiromyces venosus 120613-1]|uniref:RNA polymerase II subunit A C-terminal domain phosphatase n=1 Tax=Choiromyces venosus 120613-1 TaxID=1336337 RepID=A0A3N4JLW9_9PEZI|nr:hypothetical protein L873DRAFT_1789822 [Choiromyces venosus 120613-1]
MIVQLPRSVRFPVTITAFLKRPNDEIPRLEAVLLYTYTTTVTEYPEFGEERQVEKKLSAQFHAPVEGRLHRWLVKVGTVIDGPGVNIMEIDEPCSHEVQFAGLCSMCGQDMTLQDHGHFSNKDRATIHMVHDSMGLTVSQDEATRLEKETKRRLLESKKLSLVVDLDQTIIHATVDPTVGDWKNDPFCINHESVKDVQAFKLDEDIIGGRGTWYYVKMRPGLKEFLEHISELYELHIYTMGTRAYAMSVKKIVDPDGRIFGERVLSRDESGSMTQKSLHRIFPVDTKMVVIIDDRGDVWKWSDNLVKVRPYDFFVGIGDINSSFLPKRQEFLPPAPAANAPVNPTVSPADTEAMPIDEKVEKGDDDDDDDDDVEGVLTTQSAIGASSSATQLAALDQLVTIGEGVSAENLLNAQSKELDKALSAQKTDRPLAKKQEEQDKKDEKAANECMNSENGIESTTPSEAGRAKHSVLHDQDVELIALERHLTEVHRSFYELYENNRSVISARVSELKDPKKQVRKRRLSDTNLRAVPDVKVIMPQMKMRALGDVVLVFSGIIPLGVDVQKSFGAIIADDVHSKVTHLVAARVFDPTRRSKVPRETNDYQSRTAKVRRAASKYPHIRIVTPQWLYDSISNWRKEPEDPYLLPIHPEDRHPRALNGVNDHLDGPMLSSEDDDSDDDEMQSVHTEEFSAADMPDMTDVGWMDVDEELKEWLGSDDDEDTEAEDNNASDDKDTDNIPKKASKRSRSSTPDEETGELSLEDSIPGSRLSKRQKMVRNRPGSGLRIVEGVAPSTSSYAPPSGTDTPDSSSATLDGISEKGLEQEFDELEEAAGEEDEEDDFDGFAQEFDRELAEMEADENGDDEEDTVGDEGTIVAGAQNEHSQPESSHHLIDLGSPITDSFNSLSGAGGSLAEAGGGGGGSTNSTS